MPDSFRENPCSSSSCRQIVSGITSIANNGFTMPANDVTVKAIFEPDSNQKFNVTVTNAPPEGGTGIATPSSASPGRSRWPASIQAIVSA